MSLNILQSGVSKVALALSALTACSAPHVQRLEEPSVHLSQADVTKQRLKQRIIFALQYTGDNNAALKKVTEKLNDNTSLEDLMKFQECFTEDDRMKKFLALATALEVVADVVAPELKKCRGELDDESGDQLGANTITCMADAVVNGGIGEKFAVLTEAVNDKGAEVIYCLEQIPRIRQ